MTIRGRLTIILRCYGAYTADGSYTNVRNALENACSHRSLQFSTTREIRTINGAQTLMDLLYFSTNPA